MAKEIKIEKKQPTVEEYEYEINNIKGNHQPQIPVGTEVNGVKVIKPQTDYVEIPKTDEEFKDEALKNTKELSEKVLTKEEEEKIKEKLAAGKDIKEVIKDIEALDGKYEPGSCVDKEIQNKRLPYELKIAKYLTRQYKEAMKNIFSEMEYEDIKDILNSDKKEEIDSVIEEMVRPGYRRCKCNKEKSGAPEPVKEAFKKLGYVAPECKIVNEDIVPGDFDGICRDLMALHARKNKDYGNAAHESFKDFGLISYVIRLNDKMNRLKSLTKPGVEQEIKSESIEDTLMDLAAYAIMAIESMRS